MWNEKVGLTIPSGGMKESATQLPVIIDPDLKAQGKADSGCVNELFRKSRKIIVIERKVALGSLKHSRDLFQTDVFSAERLIGKH